MSALDDTQRELLELVSPGLFPPPATKAALPAMPAPTNPYGRDLVCGDGLEDDVESEGFPQLAQDNYHRLSTSRGFIPGYPNDGIDLRTYLSRGVTPNVLSDVPRVVRAELLKDTRNEDVRVTASLGKVDGVDGLILKIAVRPKVGVPFEMTMSATAFATRLEGVK